MTDAEELERIYGPLTADVIEAYNALENEIAQLYLIRDAAAAQVETARRNEPGGELTCAGMTALDHALKLHSGSLANTAELPFVVSLDPWERKRLSMSVNGSAEAFQYQFNNSTHHFGQQVEDLNRWLNLDAKLSGKPMPDPVEAWQIPASDDTGPQIGAA